MTISEPSETCGRILIVDDDPAARELLLTYLEDSHHTTEVATGGREAWKRLRQQDHPIDAVLLDWVMPELCGIELLRQIKDDPSLQMIPVILQSARNSPEDLTQGLAAGAFYYLEKPVHSEMLRQVVDAAVRDHRRYEQMRTALEESRTVLGNLLSARFQVQTIGEARALAAVLSQACPQPEQTVVGLGELIVNAVEHGNLAITYEEKSELLAEGRWEEEIGRRLSLPDYKDRRAIVEFTRDENELSFRIVDEGPGFDWERFLEIRPERLLDTHGRGIALARALCFSAVEYRAPGNEVTARVPCECETD